MFELEVAIISNYKPPHCPNIQSIDHPGVFTGHSGLRTLVDFYSKSYTEGHSYTAVCFLKPSLRLYKKNIRCYIVTYF